MVTILVATFAVTSAAPALPARSGPRDLPELEVPLTAVAMDAADDFATFSCAWWAKRCWSTFSPPPNTDQEGAPSLACGVEPRGEVACWGMAERGLFQSTVVLTRLPGITGAADIAVGRSQVCALGRAGELDCLHYAWDTSVHDWVFGPAVRTAGAFQAVDAGHDRLCALTSHGDVLCWTSVGDCYNDDEDTRPRPVRLRCATAAAPQIIANAGPAVKLSASWLGGCAVRTDGKLACWGENAQEDTGPVGAVVAPQLSGVVGTSASNTHACALRKNGDALCWAAERGVWASGGQGRAMIRLPSERPIREVHTKEGVTCWIDDRGAAYCREGSGSALELLDDVAELAVGDQVCARRGNGGVRCWARPLATAPRAGDLLITTSASAFVGGGASGLGRNASAASDLGVRLEMSMGRADRESELTLGGGPILELRSRDLRTREIAGGLAATYAPWRAGNLSFSGAALAGYARRARAGEPLVGILARLGLRHAFERNPRERGRLHYAMHIDVYVSGRYSLRSHALEVVGGVELDLSLPIALVQELRR